MARRPPKQPRPSAQGRLQVLARRADALADLLRDAGRRGEAQVAQNIADEIRRAA